MNKQHSNRVSSLAQRPPGGVERGNLKTGTHVGVAGRAMLEVPSRSPHSSRTSSTDVLPMPTGHASRRLSR